MRVLVLGASGMLGCRLVPELRQAGHTVICHGRSRPDFEIADLTDGVETHKLITGVSPDAIVNLVGLTDVERCEVSPKEAWRQNVHTVENAAAIAHTLGIHLVHISTDQVYDGKTLQSEGDAVPGNVYALSKYAGELAATAACSTILRTNFFGASNHASRKSLTDWIYRSLRDNEPINVFEDVRFSPLTMVTLSKMIELVIKERPLGVFNLGSKEGKNKADFAFEFATELGLPQQLMTRSSIKDAKHVKAWRPTNMCMDSSKFENALGVSLPTLVEELHLAAKDYHEHE